MSRLFLNFSKFACTRLHFIKLSDCATELTPINRIVNYIEENLGNDISLEDICNEFFLSKSQLCRMFKKSMGSTVWNYFTIKRLHKAKNMIDSGELPTEVFSLCGFNDYSVFYRACKRHFGQSPAKNAFKSLSQISTLPKKAG